MTRSFPNSGMPLKIGTRGSPLALAQAYETRDRLMKIWNLSRDAFEVIVIKTTGDRIQDRALREIGGKGLFTKEIEEDLLSGAIDIAVHSTKDMPVQQPDGLILDVYLPREDVRDGFVSLNGGTLADLPNGAVVGSSSLRRKAQLLHVRPDLKVIEFRGNVETRLQKLKDNVADATFLAMAGLNRLGMKDVPHTPVAPDHMLPAVAQGTIGIERREDDTAIAELLAPIHHVETGHRLAAERAFLAALGGSCETPIAGLATLEGGQITLKGEILRTDGTERIADAATAPIEDAAKMGQALGRLLLSQADDGFFDWKA